MNTGTRRNTSPIKGQAEQKQNLRIRQIVIGERLRVNMIIDCMQRRTGKFVSRLELGSILEFVIYSSSNRDRFLKLIIEILFSKKIYQLF